VNSVNVPVVKVSGVSYLSLDDIRKTFKSELAFDMLLQQGKLYNKSHYAVFTVGLSSILVDGRLYRSRHPVIRHRGMVLLPVDHAAAIISALYSLNISGRRDGRIYFKTKKQPPHIKKTDDKPRAKDVEPGDRISFIVIDAGHGGRDPGAVGAGSIKEKTITLQISRYLASSLKYKLKNVKISQTRSSDRFIELSRRTEIANGMLRKHENGIFLSIHVNASLSGKISGFETYFLSQNPTNEDARNTAALENNVVILEDPGKNSRKKYGDIDYIEATMITTQIQKESALLAASIQKGMEKKNRVFKSRGVRKADFYVLRGVLMPAVLVEVGFITNRKELQYLKKSSHQKKIADGVADGVVRFIRSYNRMVSGK